jgi:voltage-gated potassium channel
MTSKPAEDKASAAKKGEPFWQRLRRIVYYFEMPPSDTPTLPEVGLAKTRIKSWPLASLAVGAGFYLLFLLIGTMDGTLVWLTGHHLWRQSLVVPALLIYLLLLIAILKRVLDNAVKEYLPRLPSTAYHKQLIGEAYALRRRWEWLVVGLGFIGSWLVDPPWHRDFLAVGLYWLVGGALVFGLTAWHVYSAVVRARVLAHLYSRVQEVVVQKQAISAAPIARWILSAVSGLLGGMLLIVLLIPQAQLSNSRTLFVYGPLILVAILIIVFRKTPGDLIARVSIFRALFLFLLVAVIGTFGFAYFEGWTPDDALYATIITMTTVGYGDLSPKTDGGQLFTIALALIAVGIGGYAVSSFAAFIVEGNFNQFMQGKRIFKQIDRMNNHLILCGAGKVGRKTALELFKTGIPLVVIDQKVEVIEALRRDIDVPYIEGDATQNQVLELAGIGRARGVVAALNDDKSNAFVVLSARELARKLDNPQLRIVARVNDAGQVKKIRRAGADIVVSPKVTGGRRMAGMMLYPSVFSFLDEMVRAEQQTGQTLRLEEVHVNQINNPSLLELIRLNELRVGNIGQYTGLMVVAIKRHQTNGGPPYIYTPRGNTPLEQDDILIVLGTPEERAKLKVEEKASAVEQWQSKLEGLRRKWTQKFNRN